MRIKKWRTYLIGTALLSLLTAAPMAASAASYTVGPSDSLWSISVKFDTTIAKLKQMNGLTSDMLLTGQVLQVPPPSYMTAYKAQAGDTMWIIANRYSIPLNKLLAANSQLADPNVIWQGLDLNVPKRPAGFRDGFFPLKKGTYSPYGNTYADSRTWSSDGATVRSHEGVDIMAAEGTPIYSALSGTVVQAGWSELGGWRLTIRVDGTTEFYYAHMSRYAPGMAKGAAISKGQLIGYVGSTGYGPEGTKGKFDPHLHFGIYKTSPYASVDPFLFLKWWELG
ncbi:M23 family metallopeptidase [Paenibacillus sp. MMS18-CY102]|uniref:M23 family metallopeptidase n=1 Tax=Paenibacillus sp. MMS18-CY102 TaxID=2682849 RepID=UPI001365EE69|nr:M23 family metallopeptidase [Paenibacillus sp. MMS18-CY102]MWC27010.1 peptidoglycan DD-metalloendopeptidase family protein [Paenibacillus sp. MMS18-CY102]